MNKVQFTVNGLHAVIWHPEDSVKTVLQITPGMTEHMGRYEDFADALCRQGIAVAGFDLRGHGQNPGSPEIASFGEGGWTASLEDIRKLFLELRQRFPGAPHHMLGFSLGSFLLREYLGIYPEGVASAIIAGTGHESGWLLGILMRIVTGQIKTAGFDGTTDLIKQLSFGTYNQSFRPNRTEADWLCGDARELDRYLSDPLVRKNISAGLFRDLLGSMKKTGKAESFSAWNKEMPVLLHSGAADPVGKSGKGVEHLRIMLQKAGLTQVVSQSFPGARHDIFHETDSGTAASVRRCLMDWLLA